HWPGKDLACFSFFPLFFWYLRLHAILWQKGATPLPNVRGRYNATALDLYQIFQIVEYGFEIGGYIQSLAIAKEKEYKKEYHCHINEPFKGKCQNDDDKRDDNKENAANGNGI